MIKFTYILNLGNGQWFMAYGHIYEFYKDIMILSTNYKDLKIVALKVITLKEQIDLYRRFKIYKIAPNLYYSSKELSEAAEIMGISKEVLKFIKYNKQPELTLSLYLELIYRANKYNLTYLPDYIAYWATAEYINLLLVKSTDSFIKEVITTIEELTTRGTTNAERSPRMIALSLMSKYNLLKSFTIGDKYNMVLANFNIVITNYINQNFSVFTDKANSYNLDSEGKKERRKEQRKTNNFIIKDKLERELIELEENQKWKWGIHSDKDKYVTTLYKVDNLYHIASTNSPELIYGRKKVLETLGKVEIIGSSFIPYEEIKNIIKYTIDDEDQLKNNFLRDASTIIYIFDKDKNKEVQKYIEQAVANRDENNLEYIYRVDGIATNLGIEYEGNKFFKWFKKEIKEKESLYRLLRRSFSKNNIKKTSKKIAIIKVRNMIERKYEDLVRSECTSYTGLFSKK